MRAPIVAFCKLHCRCTIDSRSSVSDGLGFELASGASKLNCLSDSIRLCLVVSAVLPKPHLEAPTLSFEVGLLLVSEVHEVQTTTRLKRTI